MSELSARILLAIWENGDGQRPLDRGFAMLHWLHPEEAEDRLAMITIGERDRQLINYRERIFGPNFRAFSACPKCGEKLEFEMNTPDLLKDHSKVDDKDYGPNGLSVGKYKIAFRLLNCSDLSAAAEAATPEEAKAVLFERCIEMATYNGTYVEFSALPEDIIAELGARLAEANADAENILGIECPSCRHSWPMDFDIASFLYAEISAWARRLLEDVNILASAYGWSEREILEIPPVRRQSYLDKVR